MTIISLISAYVTFYADFKNVFVLFVQPVVVSIRPHYHFGKALFEGSYLCKATIIKLIVSHNFIECVGGR